MSDRQAFSFACSWPYYDMQTLGIPIPFPITRENMRPHAGVLCEDFGNDLRQLLGMDECECPCHEGEETASTLRKQVASP